MIYSFFITQLQQERSRWILWLPVFLGGGISLYFSLSYEPQFSSCYGLFLMSVTLLILSSLDDRLEDYRFILLCIFMFVLGFCLTKHRTDQAYAPRLSSEIGPISVDAVISNLEPLDKGQRVILDKIQTHSDEPQALLVDRLVHIRLFISNEYTVSLREKYRFKVTLFPPPEPTAPGSFDFSRQAYFQKIGAVGYVLEEPEKLSSEDQNSLLILLEDKIASLRDHLTKRIVESISQDNRSEGTGWTAAALITAERGPVSQETFQNYRDAGLAHILVIAGMHLSMVAGILFVWIRALLALSPFITLRFNIKKITAFGALIITFFYLIISGGLIPTRRAFIMNGLILWAVLSDRRAMSFRSISCASTLLLMLEPEALLGASFQLSFSAVYGLIAAYESLGEWLSNFKKRLTRRVGSGLFGSLISHALSILLTSQVAGMSTAYFTLFHFNRFASYGLLGNIIAVPLVGLWVMPAALLSFILMPFGLDGFGWRLMGRGIDSVSRVAHWVSSLPGASITLSSVPIESLIIFTVGGFWLCLWREYWRFLGLVPMMIAVWIAYYAEKPFLYIDKTGELIALRDQQNHFHISSLYRQKILSKSWLKQVGEEEYRIDWEKSDLFDWRCKESGCSYFYHHFKISFLRDYPDESKIWCDSDVIVLKQNLTIDCPQSVTLISDQVRRNNGTMILSELNNKLHFHSVKEWQGQRPWSNF